MEYDLIIRDGMVIDGSGRSRVQADVGVKDGVVAQIGRIRSSAKEVIDADGLVVAPGFIDPHTHYDAQLWWDPLATTSTWHGVTTVVTGNCGYTLAPVRPGDHDYMTKTFAKVEEVSLSALELGIPWSWESFGDYLDQLRRRLGVNVAPYIGHTAIRRYVLGDAASEREATEDEIDLMMRQVENGMRAGAAGFSTALSPSAVGWNEEPVPSRLATDHEVERLCEVVAKANAGTLMILPRSSVFGVDGHDRDFLIKIARMTRRNVIIQSRLIPEAIAVEAPVFGVLQVRPFDRIFNLKQTSKGTSILDGMLSWGRVMRVGLEERLRLLSDGETRAAMREDALRPNTDSTKGVVLPGLPWETTFVHRVELGTNKRHEGKSIAELAREQGKHIADALIDLALEEDLETSFRTVRERDHDADEALCRDLRSPYALVGISDAGAHLGRDDGAYYTTYFLEEFVREKGIFSLEEAVRMLSFKPASVLGLSDRGLLQPGYAADIVIFDAESVRLVSKSLANDLPGGGQRWVAVPDGMKYTIVNGEVVLRDLKPSGHLPGRILRPTG